MSETIIVKKYANRRLYDTKTSSYITQEDLLELAKKGEEFEVKDAKTGDDLTRNVLTQIIFEEESKKAVPLMPISFLRRLIRVYDNNMQSLVPGFLEKTMESFFSLEKHTGIEKIESAVKANIEFVQSGMQLFNPFAGILNGKTKKEKLRKIVQLEEEIGRLKKEISES